MTANTSVTNAAKAPVPPRRPYLTLSGPRRSGCDSLDFVPFGFEHVDDVDRCSSDRERAGELYEPEVDAAAADD